MKECPILFNAEMVRAILDGRKTQTRPVVKLKSEAFISAYRNIPMTRGTPLGYDDSRTVPCPYGEFGDRLWVRETWFCDHFEVLDSPYQEVENAKDSLYYAADDPNGDITNLIPECDLENREHIRRDRRANIWKPSIHMPRWASRINLEITDIRVQRIQEISEEDAESEGVQMPNCTSEESNGWTFKKGFEHLWDSINGKGSYSWSSNPWVWCVSFRRIEP